MLDIFKEKEIQKELEELWETKTYYQPDDLFRVDDGNNTYIFNRKYIIAIDTDGDNPFKDQVVVHTIERKNYTLNMKIDDFIDQMEGSK